MRERIYQVIGAACGWGAQIRTCEDGPDHLKTSGCLSTERWEVLYPKQRFREINIPLSEALPMIVDFNRHLADQVLQAMQREHFPIVIGGDHSVAVGTWNGVGCFFHDQPLGLIWIDAHMDGHTPETTLSGAWHGMPLAALLGYGSKELAELKRSRPILSPQHTCLIGIRCFEEGETQLLESLNVRIYFIEEVKRRGFAEVLREAIAYVSRGTVGYGVSLDIDVIDPSQAPGIGSPEQGGIDAEELMQGIPLFAGDPQLKAFEVVEFNPHLDIDGRTEKICRQITTSLREAWNKELLRDFLRKENQILSRGHRAD